MQVKQRSTGVVSGVSMRRQPERNKGDEQRRSKHHGRGGLHIALCWLEAITGPELILINELGEDKLLMRARGGGNYSLGGRAAPRHAIAIPRPGPPRLSERSEEKTAIQETRRQLQGSGH